MKKLIVVILLSAMGCKRHSESFYQAKGMAERSGLSGCREPTEEELKNDSRAVIVCTGIPGNF